MADTTSTEASPIRKSLSNLEEIAGRLRELVLLAAPVRRVPNEVVVDASRAVVDPGRLRAILLQSLADQVSRIVVTGTLERRLILIERVDRRWVIADLSGLPHSSRAWPVWFQQNAVFEHPESWCSVGRLHPWAVRRLMRPVVLLVALYHPEVFPLPRFALGISDLARAARSSLVGQIRLADMQLGLSLDEVVLLIEKERPDVVGVSATFGQHDLLMALLTSLSTLDAQPLVVAGGSLPALNEGLLLDRFPDVLVARGAGEATFQDILAYWHGDLAVHQVRGIGYRGAGLSDRSTTKRVPNRLQTDILPELDLLEPTLAHQGVMQLESSRGCTHACSFCPRAHKGGWYGHDPDSLHTIIAAASDIYARHLQSSRTIFLVDEEFIGRDMDDGAARRALAVGDLLHSHGFRWETSTRIDQVYREDRGLDWLARRVHLWRTLRGRGLARCLFGVESGVDSILARFNKRTTAAQNVLAIRLLTACGVPIRCTYITFDHLMSESELRASYQFQGRCDLLLEPLDHLSAMEILAGIQDDDFVRAHALNIPFFTSISYMLVSMECLLGSPYLRMVEQRGLARDFLPSMGRRNADFADRRIGELSNWAQRWIDRNFSFDYTLKSLEKLLAGPPHAAVRHARRLVKESAYTVLGSMLMALGTLSSDPGMSTTDSTGSPLNTALPRLVEAEFGMLVERMGRSLADARRLLSPQQAEVLDREFQRWSERSEWNLINASDACGVT